MKKIIRIATSGGSLRSLLKGQLGFMNQYYEVIGVVEDFHFEEFSRSLDIISVILLPVRH